MVLELTVDLDTGSRLKLLLSEHAIASEIVEQVVRLETSKASFNTDFSLEEEDVSMLLEHRGGSGQLQESLIGPEVPCGDLMNGVVKIYGVKRCYDRAVVGDIARFSSNLAMMAAAFSQSVSGIDHTTLMSGCSSGGVDNPLGNASFHNNHSTTTAINSTQKGKKKDATAFNSVKEAFMEKYSKFSREMLDLIATASRSKEVQAAPTHSSALNTVRAALLRGDLSSVMAALQLPTLNFGDKTVQSTSSLAVQSPATKTEPKKLAQPQQHSSPPPSTEISAAQAKRRETRKEQNAKRKEKRALLRDGSVKTAQTESKASTLPIESITATATTEIIQDVVHDTKKDLQGSPSSEDMPIDFVEKIKKEVSGKKVEADSSGSSSPDSDDDSEDLMPSPVQRVLAKSKLMNGAVIKTDTKTIKATADVTKVRFCIYSNDALDSYPLNFYVE